MVELFKYDGGCVWYNRLIKCATTLYEIHAEHCGCKSLGTWKQVILASSFFDLAPRHFPNKPKEFERHRSVSVYRWVMVLMEDGDSLITDAHESARAQTQ
jgi:hypothetical protein